MLMCEPLPAAPGSQVCWAPAVRPAEPSDYPAIRAVLDLAYAQYMPEIAPQVWARFRADLLDLDRHARDGQLLVALVDEDVAGYAAFYPDASVQDLGWPAGWAGGRGLAVHPAHRGSGVAIALMATLECRARASGAPVFAFHTSAFMTAARALYERLVYRRAPQFDLDLHNHYGIDGGLPWTALAYATSLDAVRAASAHPGWRTEKAS